MNLFNLKKKHNYKNITLNEINKLEIKDLSKYENYSEKELILELFKIINLQNIKINDLSNKIDNSVSFKKIDELSNDLNKKQIILNTNIDNFNQKINDLQNIIFNLNKNIDKFNQELDNILKNKDKLEKNYNDVNVIIPQIEDSILKISDISKTLNKSITQHSYSPINTLNKINEKLGQSYDDTYNRDNIYSILRSIDKKLNSSIDNDDFESLNTKIDYLQDKLNEYDLLSQKIDDLKDDIEDISFFINN